MPGERFGAFGGACGRLGSGTAGGGTGGLRQLTGTAFYSPPAAQVVAGERFGASREPRGRALVDDLASGRARSRPEVEDPIRGPDHLGVVLDDEDGVARVPQPVQHPDHAGEVAGVEPDARLVEHEQGVDERGPESGGEVDALDLAPLRVRDWRSRVRYPRPTSTR